MRDQIREAAEVDEASERWLEFHKAVHKKLEGFLKIIQSMKNLKTVSLSDYYSKLFMDLIRKTSESIQSLALNCLLLFKNELLIKYEKTFKSLQKVNYRLLINRIKIISKRT